MTAKQKAARTTFKKVVAEAKKLRNKNPKLTQAQAVKQAWAIHKKVGAIKIVEKGESKSARPSATYEQKRTKKGTYAGLKKVGAADSKWGVYVGSSLRETFSDEMAAYRYADLIRSSQKLPSTFVKVKKIRKSKKVGAVKKKASKKSSSIHKDTKSHNVNIRVVSGLHRINGIEPSDFTRINNDTYGNPRYVIHFLQLLNDQERMIPSIDEKYRVALKKAKKIGGKKFSNKQYGGGIVFQSYNIYDLAMDLDKLRKL